MTFVHNGVVLSTAVICPGYAFDQFGATGPRISPDNHWVLVDVKGPFAPGNVPRTQALVQVETGGVVLAPSFPRYLGVSGTEPAVGWASGERATLAYANGKSATIHDEPLRPIPRALCLAPSPAPRTGGASS